MQHNLEALLSGSNSSSTETVKQLIKSQPPIVSTPIVNPPVKILQVTSEQAKNLMTMNAIVPPKKITQSSTSQTAIVKSPIIDTEDEEDIDGNKIKKHQGRLLGKSSVVVSQYPTNTHLDILNGPNVQAPPFKNEAGIQEISNTPIKEPNNTNESNMDALVSIITGKRNYTKDVDLSGLSDGQKSAIEAVLMGKNILLTGPAGTGKSHCIQKIRDVFQAKRMNVAMTSTTGASAILVDGMTVHSWSGIGVCSSRESALKRVLQYKAPQARIKSTSLLIIDEVSMLSGLLLDIIDYVTRMVRQDDTPFGGLQVLLCGDFYQLSPVKAPTYAFESESFEKLIQEVHELTFIFRQNNEAFCQALNEIRIGEVSEKTKLLLNQCIGRSFEGDIKPTVLFPVREDVNFMNEAELWNLATETNRIREIAALDEVIEKPPPKKPHLPKFLKESKDRLNKDCIAPELLQLAVGAQVMLIKNLDVEAGLANGSRGVVVGFDGNGAPIVKFRNNQVLYMATQVWWMRINETTRIRRTQYPLILAFAITIHKSQGQSIDLLQADLGERIFADGMTYTAISRARNLDSLILKSIDWEQITANKKVKAFYAKHAKK
jgi:ATP-dependent DNA helicase PIF1